MFVVIKINCNTEAFEDYASQQVAAILCKLAKRISGHPHFSPGHDQALYDMNRVEVGYCTVEEGEAQIA